MYTDGRMLQLSSSSASTPPNEPDPGQEVPGRLMGIQGTCGAGTVYPDTDFVDTDGDVEMIEETKVELKTGE